MKVTSIVTFAIITIKYAMHKGKLFIKNSPSQEGLRWLL